MDIKTLEYMEERAKKARKIINLIDDLKKQLKSIDQTERVLFSDDYGNFKARIYNHATAKAIAQAAAKEIEKRISELEQELAEL